MTVHNSELFSFAKRLRDSHFYVAVMKTKQRAADVNFNDNKKSREMSSQILFIFNKKRHRNSMEIA